MPKPTAYKGQTLDVEVDTHVIGNLEFRNGAIASMTTSFDVWDSEMPRIEIYGTEGTICINDPDLLDGPIFSAGTCCCEPGTNTDSMIFHELKISLNGLKYL